MFTPAQLVDDDGSPPAVGRHPSAFGMAAGCRRVRGAGGAFSLGEQTALANMRYHVGMKRAATYVRISYDRRGEGAGVERQRVDTDRLAKQLGYEIVERIVDNDRSASRKARRRREGFERLLELARSGEVEGVIVHDLDRFTRNADELRPWIEVAEQTGVKIHTTGEILDLADADSLFRARILLAVAEKESANIARRVSAKLRHDAEAGRPHWSTRPFGFERDGTLVPSEAAELRRMYAEVIDGASQASIAKRLNESAVPNASGARWQSATVGFLIRAPRNAGLRHYRGEIIGPGTWEPIVSEETWRAAVAAIDARKVGRRSGGRSLLGGLVRCSSCGATMSRSGRSYRCVGRSDGYRVSCGVSISGDRLDEYVTGLVLAAVGDVKSSRSRSKPTPSADLSGEVVRLRNDVDELAAMFGRGELSLSAFKSAKAPLDQRLAAAEAALATVDTTAALARLTGDTSTLADRWPDLDVALRGRIVSTVIERVEVRKASDGERFAPSRFDVRWAQ